MKLERQSQVERRGGFTLIEIMIVVGLIGLICTTAIPSIYQLAHKTGMRRAVVICGTSAPMPACNRFFRTGSGRDVLSLGTKIRRQWGCRPPLIR